jgi:quercetin dioxygenase-like cupin family protein
MEPTGPYVADSATQQQLAWLGGSVLRIVLDGQQTGGQLTVLRTRVAAGGGAPRHVHTDEDEIFLLLDGAGVFWVDAARYEVGAGGVVVLPRGRPHAYQITSATADVLTCCTPAGIEGFFRALGHDLDTPLPPGWTLDPAALRCEAARYGIAMLGPPGGALGRAAPT